MSEQTTTHDPFTSHSVTYGEGHPHEGEGGHKGDKEYVIVAAGLAVITAAEVAWSYLGAEGAWLVVPLLLIMAIKFAMVGAYFMHLKYDNRLLNRVFYTGVFLAGGVYIAALLSLHF